MMIGYDIYECFIIEHFRLSQRMTLTPKIYCSRLYTRKMFISRFFFDQLYQLSRAVKITGIREVRFINQTILTKSVCNGFKPITTQNNKMFRLVFVRKT
jgi:hypothetical protein